MKFDVEAAAARLEASAARLELRVMETEDTSRALVGVVRTMNDMLSHISEMTNYYADALGGMVLALPSVAHRLPLWPVAARACRPPGPVTPGEGNQGCAGYCCGASPGGTPTSAPH